MHVETCMTRVKEARKQHGKAMARADQLDRKGQTAEAAASRLLAKRWGGKLARANLKLEEAVTTAERLERDAKRAAAADARAPLSQPTSLAARRGGRPGKVYA